LRTIVIPTNFPLLKLTVKSGKNMISKRLLLKFFHERIFFFLFYETKEKERERNKYLYFLLIEHAD